MLGGLAASSDANTFRGLISSLSFIKQPTLSTHHYSGREKTTHESGCSLDLLTRTYTNTGSPLDNV